MFTKKNLKRTTQLGILLLTLSGVVVPTTTLAHVNKDGQMYTSVPPWDSNDPASWQQFDPSTGIPMNKKGILGQQFDGNYRFPQDACMIFSTTFIGLKAGSWPLGTTPAEVHDKAYDAGTFIDYQGTRFIDYSRIGQIQDALEFHEWVNFTLANLKKAYDDGYYVIITVSNPVPTVLAHDFALDYVEGDGTKLEDFHILDSGWWGVTLADFYSDKNLSGITMFKSTKGRPSNKSPRLQANRDGKLDNFATDTPTTSGVPDASYPNGLTRGGGAIPFKPDESKIPNMPGLRDWGEMRLSSSPDAITPDAYNKATTAAYLEFLHNPEGIHIGAEPFEVGSNEAQSIANWKEERETNVVSKGITTMRRAIAIAGILLAILSGSLIFLYIFDRFNPTGFSIISTLTKGKVVVIGSKREFDKKLYKGKRVLTDLNIFGYTALISLLSVLLLSGTFYQILQFFFGGF